MAKKDEPQGIQCENVDIELLRRQLARLETIITDKFSEVRELIENAPAQMPVFPPPAEPTQPLPVEVNLPDNLARSEDISNMVGIIKTLNGTVSLVMQGLAELQTVFKAIPKPDVEAIAQSAAVTAVNRLGNDYLGKITDKIDSGLSKSYTNGQSRATAIGHDDASAINSRLGRIEDSITLKDKTAHKNKVIRILSYCLVGMVALVSILGWYGSSVRSERNELLKVEWLYRLERTQCPNQKFINRIEQEILHGNERDFEEWKTIIVGKEAKGLEFVYFAPHDDWEPKQKDLSPDQKSSQKPQPTEHKQTTPQPHKQKSNLTPGEIEAIKAMRADPNIPEDAKPPLPEGY